MSALPSRPGDLGQTLDPTRPRSLIVLGAMLAFIVAGSVVLSGGNLLGILILSPIGLLLALGMLRGIDALASRFGYEGVFWLALMLAASIAFRAPSAPALSAALPTHPLQVLEPSIGLICAAFLGARILRAGRKALDWARNPVTAPLLIYSLFGMSASFSVSHGANALFYAGELVVALGLTVLVANREKGSNVEGSELLLITAGTVVALALLLAAFAPGYAFTLRSGEIRRLGGWLMHPNQLGFLAAASSLGFLQRLLTGPSRRGLVLSTAGLAASAWALGASRGRADFAGFAAGAFLVLLASKRGRWLLLAVPSGLIALVIHPQWAYPLVLLANRGMTTLRSLRPPLWLNIWQQTLASPARMLRGVGIGVGRFQLEGLFPKWPDPAHAHNVLFEGLLALGFPGALLILSAILILGWKILVLVNATWRAPHPLLVEALAVFVCLMMVSAVEASFAGRVSAYTCSYLALDVAVIRLSRTPDPIQEILRS